MTLSQHSAWPHSGLAGWDARREEQIVVIPPERRTTQQTARKATAHTGFALEARLTSLLALPMVTDIRRGSRLADGPQGAKCDSRGMLR